MNKVDKKEEYMTLTEQQVRFFEYFITSYLKNMSIGRIEEAHHDSVAITLQMAAIFNIEVENERL